MTALVNEAYLKLVNKSQVEWEYRNHFFAIAAHAMRQILVDHAGRKKTRQTRRRKLGGKEENLPPEDRN